MHNLLWDGGSMMQRLCASS